MPSKHIAGVSKVVSGENLNKVTLSRILLNQAHWSHETFGPQFKPKGNIDHIRKELKEYEDNPSLKEAVDVFILAMELLWRTAREEHPHQVMELAVIDAITSKMDINLDRIWPDWRTADPNKAIEHIKDESEVAKRTVSNDTSNGFPEVGALLRECADTFDERNAVYGNNYAMVGKVMAALFPNGITLKTVDDHNRFHLFMLKIVKLTRYSINYDQGGHADSAVDDIVYTAMVAGLDGRAAKTGD